jgi:ABC-type dipeptide/oligopeptide/nickel transport system permease component
MGSILFAALLIGVANLFVDLLYTWFDPRVRLE